MRQGTYDPIELEQSLSAHSVEYLLKAECIELPSINGDNLLGWASRVEAYLVVQDLLVATRAASTVGINLEGRIWYWFKAMKEAEPELDREKLKLALFIGTEIIIPRGKCVCIGV